MCQACCLGKVHKLPFLVFDSIYHYPLNLIYTDIWGPSPIPSKQGYRYYILFMDAHRKFTWLYFLQNRSEVPSVFIQFKTMVELQLNTKIKALQTDGAKEYLALTKYLADHGIQHCISCPHTHEQNGAPERKHRHLTETGLTLLAASSLPSKFWVEAFSTATFIINRIPSSMIKYKSSFEVLFHKTPDYSIFKPFGCLCDPYLRPYTKTKLDFRSTPCIFLGYNTKYKGYKCITNSGKEYTVRHIIFDETQYPMITNPSFFAQNTSVTSTFSTLPPPIP